MGSKKYYVEQVKGKNPRYWKLDSNNIYKLCSPVKQGSELIFYAFDLPAEIEQNVQRISKKSFYQSLDKLYANYNEYWEYDGDYYYSGPRFKTVEEFMDKGTFKYVSYVSPNGSKNRRLVRMVYYLGKVYLAYRITDIDCITNEAALYDIAQPWVYRGCVEITKISPVYKMI